MSCLLVVPFLLQVLDQFRGRAGPCSQQCCHGALGCAPGVSDSRKSCLPVSPVPGLAWGFAKTRSLRWAAGGEPQVVVKIEQDRAIIKQVTSQRLSQKFLCLCFYSSILSLVTQDPHTEQHDQPAETKKIEASTDEQSPFSASAAEYFDDFFEENEEARIVFSAD